LTFNRFLLLLEENLLLLEERVVTT
jgi:hypothetical protein